MSAPAVLDNSQVGYVAAVEVFASEERTTDPTTVQLHNATGRVLMVFVDITDVGVDAPEITLSIYGVDPLSGETYLMLASAALSTVAGTRLIVSPDLTAVGNQIAKNMVPSEVQIAVVHTNADPITYSVAAEFLPA